MQPSQRDEHGEAQLLSPICLTLGLALFWPSLFQANYYTCVPLADTSAKAALATLSELLGTLLPPVLLVVSLVVAALGRRLGPHRLPQLVITGFAGCVGAALLPINAAIAPAIPTLTVCGCILSCLFLSGFMFQWIHLVQNSKPSSALGYITSSYLICESLQLLFGMLPSWALLIYHIAAPLSCTALLLLPTRRLPTSRGQSSRPLRSVPRWRSALFTIVLCALLVAANTVLGSAINGALAVSGSSLVPSVPGIAAGIMLLSTSALVFCRHAAKDVTPFPFFLSYSAIYLLSFLLVIALPYESASLCEQVMMATSHCLEVFLLMAAVWMTCTWRIASSTGCLLFLCFGPVCLFLAHALRLEAVIEAVCSQSALLRISGIVLFAATLLIGFSIIIRTRERSKERGDDRKSKAEILERWCTEALAPFALAPKELQAATYGYRGHTLERIAEEMGVQKTTVETYFKRIYRKCSVHSRQELIDLVDARPDAEREQGRSI